MITSFLSLALQPSDLNSNEKDELARRWRDVPSGEKMTALTISARVIERLAPFLGRVAKASPGHWAKLIEALKTKGVMATSTIADLVNYVRQNPANAALVFATIASVGIPIADLFSSEDKADAEVRRTAIALDQTTLNSMNSKLAANAAASENMKLGVADREMDIRTLQAICSWSKSHFGSAAAALEAHQKMQAFVEIPYADLEVGFRLLK